MYPIADVTASSSTNLSGTVITSYIPFDYETYKRFSVAMFVRLSNHVNPRQTTLVNIKPASGCISEVLLQLNDTNITATFTLTDNQIIHLSHTIYSDWSFLAVQYNWFWFEMSLIVDHVFKYKTFTTPSTVSQHNPNTQLEIEIGAATGAFDGQISCLALFNSPLSETSASDLLKERCNLHKDYVAPAPDDPKALAIWPLNTNSQDFEMMSNTTTSGITEDMCWRFNTINANNIDSEAVRFYGSDQFSLVIDKISVCEQSLFCFGMLVKAEDNATGTILQAFLQSHEATPVNYELKITLEENSLNVYTMTNKSGMPCPALLNVAFTTMKWTAIVIEGNVVGKFNLILDGLVHNIASRCGPITNILYSKIILGGHPASNGGFLGEMRCLSIFDKAPRAEMAHQLLEQGCLSSLDYKPVPKPEVQTTTSFRRLDSKKTMADKRTSDMSLLNRNHSLYFDGSSLLHVLLDVQIPTDDMSIEFFFRPAKYTKGVIMKSDDILISIEKNILSIQLAPECDEMNFSQVPNGDWHWLMINRVTSCKSLIFVLDGEVKYAHSECFEKSGLMKVRLGGESRSFNNYRGDLSCFTVFTKTVNPEVGEQSMIDSCNMDGGNDYSIEGIEATYLDISNTKYQLITVKAIPNLFSVLRDFRANFFF